MILIHERVEELAKQADEYLLDKVQEENRSSWAQVFAELIVRECAEVVTDAVDQREPASTYADKIKQHFGVEEYMIKEHFGVEE
jgi:hypothetical protein